MLIDMIGDRLKELRTAAGMNQPEFAAVVGTSKQYVSQLEAGKNLNPRADYVEGWARRFGVNSRWLISGTGPKYVAASVKGTTPLPLDQNVIESTHKAMEEMYTRNNRHYPKEDVARFLLLYSKLALRQGGVCEAELFGAGLSDAVTSVGASIGRDVGLPGKGPDAKVVARRVRRKT